MSRYRIMQGDRVLEEQGGFATDDEAYEAGDIVFTEKYANTARPSEEGYALQIIKETAQPMAS